jgi:hypothetical protein
LALSSFFQAVLLYTASFSPVEFVDFGIQDRRECQLLACDIHEHARELGVLWLHGSIPGTRGWRWIGWPIGVLGIAILWLSSATTPRTTAVVSGCSRRSRLFPLSPSTTAGAAIVVLAHGYSGNGPYQASNRALTDTDAGSIKA